MSIFKMDSTKKETRCFWKINIQPEMFKMKLEDILDKNAVSIKGKSLIPTKITIDVQHISTNPPIIQPDWYKIDGKWNHCITVFDGSEIKRYVNGKLQ